MKNRPLRLAALLLILPALNAQLTLAPYFGDHMVLQRNQPVPVWGTAAPGESVTVSFRNHTRTATAATDGRWLVRLPNLSPGEPAELRIHAGPDTVTLTDVLVGDVWLCGGQSNMAMSLQNAADGDTESAAAHFPEIRLLTIENHFAPEPISTAEGSWKPCTPESAAAFSAVAYFFGCELHRELNVPIGLISSNWGGTPAEAWTPLEFLTPYPDLTAQYETLRDQLAAEPELQARLDAEINAFSENAIQRFESLPPPEPELFDPAHTLTDAQPVTPGQNFLQDIDGIVLIRTVFTLTPEQAAAPAAVLHLGRINDHDITWLNGVHTGTTGPNIPRSAAIPREYPVPPGTLRPGPNVLIIQLSDMFRNASFGNNIKTPALRLTGTESVPLPGPWQMQIVHDYGSRPNPLPITARNTPAFLFNAMIAPLTPAALRGVIWYQGEANAQRAAQYQTLFPALITAWRQNFQQENLPFYFVQLPNFMGRTAEPGESNWAELREAQRLTLALPHTGMAVTLDLGEADDIHPKNKRDVGLRLARIALAETYSLPSGLPHTGPLFRKVLREGSTLRLRFDHAEGGLQTTDGTAPKAFALAPADGPFRWAEARIDGSDILVAHPDIPSPARLRYAWANNPEINLVNTAGIPASPFQTEIPEHE